MNLKAQRKQLGLTLQAAADLIGVTREAVRLAEAGEAPEAAKKLAAQYKARVHRAAKRTAKDGLSITFTFARRDDGKIVLRSECEQPFEPSLEFIDALLKGFAEAQSKAGDVEV
jgi:transcriptional regulator with XRE-family HTH domain